MNQNTLKAKELLQSRECTCVLVKDNSIYESCERGVKPLLQWLESNTDLNGYSAADKVVGRAAAYLYVLMGIKEIYADVISEPSLAVLRKYGIKVTYGLLVNAIRNRTNTGFCPMEQATMNSDTPQEALNAIKSALAK